MDKADKLTWFNEIMQAKMLRHKEDPNKLSYGKLLDWLEEELKELREALIYGSREEAIKECADVANIAYFLARKIKMEKPK